MLHFSLDDIVLQALPDRTVTNDVICNWIGLWILSIHHHADHFSDISIPAV